MIKIGELLNSSVPKTLSALQSRDEKYLTEVIVKQTECGAEYLDINTALLGDDEQQGMEWLINLTLANSNCGFMLDSPNPNVLQHCLNEVGGRRVLINSVTAEQRFLPLLRDALACNAGVVCLPLSAGHIPQTARERADNAKSSVDMLTTLGYSEDNIYIDILAEAIASNQNAATVMLETLRLVKSEMPCVKTICGLSNVSFGLPKRAAINAAFLAMALAAKLNSAILDVTSHELAKTFAAANAVLGYDEYCMEYIRFCKA